MRPGLAVVLALMLCGAAHAHKLKVYAMGEGKTISGYAYFPGGGRAKGVEVQLQDAVGKTLATTTTDEGGDFAFQAPFKCDCQVVVDSGDGHRGTWSIGADELSDDLPRPEGAPAEPPPAPGEPSPDAPTQGPPAAAADLEAMVERAVSKQVRPLRAQLEAYEEKRRLHDILGGIGYIAGVAGVAFYFLGVRRREAGQPPPG